MLEYLHSINLHIFDDLFQNRETDYDPRHAVLYILTAYSEDSPLIILRQDSRVEQENICDYLGIPELYRHNFINLVDKSIRRAVTNYVHSFSSQTFRWLMFAKIQYRDYEMIVTNRDFKVAEGDTNTYNYSMPDHNKAVMAMYSLAKAISQCEKEISQEVKRKGSILEMEEVKSDGKGKNGRKRFNGSIENIIK
jgi:hypothetical protein